MASLFETLRSRLGRLLSGLVHGDGDAPPSAKSDWHHCRCCGRDRILGTPYDKDGPNEFHFIPNVGGGYTFPYCETCHCRVSLGEKKILIWRLVSCAGFWPGEEEEDAIRRLERGEMLCRQIDKGL